MAYWIVDFSERARRSPLLKLLAFWRNFDRAHPFIWLLLFTAIFFVVGLLGFSIILFAGSAFLLGLFIIIGIFWFMKSYG